MSGLIDRNDAVEAIEFEKVYMTAYKGSSNGYVSEGNPLKQYNKGLDGAIKEVNSLPSAEPEQKKGRKFLGIVVRYPKICTYPEYEGKPYYSIKYEENGEMIVGYGTYKPEVLSQYLREDFISPAEPERKKGYWIVKEEDWRKQLEWDECSEYGEWLPHPHEREWDVCSVCGIGCKRREFEMQFGQERFTEYSYQYCPHCGAEMTRGE